MLRWAVTLEATMIEAIFWFVVTIFALIGLAVLIGRVLAGGARAGTEFVARQSEIAHGRTPATKAQIAEARFRATHRDWPEAHIQAYLTMMGNSSK